MTLQAKFGVLIALLALTAAVCLGTAAWSVAFVQSQTSRAFDGAADVLMDLRRIQAELDTIETSILGYEPGHSGIQHALGSIDATAEQLFQRPELQQRAGVGTPRSLAALIHNVLAAGATWEAAPTPEAGESLTQAIVSTRAVSALIERQILNDTREAIGHADDMKTAVFRVLAIALVSAMLISLLGSFLLRRWVIRPVDAVRAATARIAAGDFSQRIPVQGHDELAQLSAEVNHMSETIVSMQDERVQRERLAAIGEMVRRLTHNIRNPLAGIRSLAEFSRDELEAGSTLHDNQDRIVKSVDQFEKWLSELLESTSPLELRLEVQETAPWLHALAESNQAMAAGKHVGLDINVGLEPRTARFDDRHLEHAIVALLTNAIEATEAGGRVALESGCDDSGANWVIRVSDTGPGIPEELISSIFTAHFTTKRNGNGIGLAVARQVVLGHGGTITVSNEGGSKSSPAQDAPGAVFTVAIPVSPSRNGTHASMATAKDS